MRILAMVALLGAPGALALADGGFFPPLTSEAAALSAAQKALIIHSPGAEALMLQTTYSGPAADFAWVVPVPARPKTQDIQVGNPAFFDAVFTATSPTVTTEVRVVGGEMMGAADAPAPGAPGMATGQPGGPRVVVYDRLKVGPYEATVLAATGPGVLTAWLRDHGYRFPEDGQQVVDAYVERRWFFVALRITPEDQGQADLMTDLPPLQVTFEAGLEPVFPLQISQVSAPEQNAIDLVVLAEGPRKPEEVPLAQLAAKAAPGVTIWGLLCQACAGGKAVMLHCGPVDPASLAASQEGLDENALPVDASFLADCTATRLWMRLAREQLQDLHFVPADVPGDYLRVEFYRLATLHLPRPRVPELPRVGPGWWVTALRLFWVGVALVIGVLLGFAIARLTGRPTPPPSLLMLPVLPILLILAFAGPAVAGFVSGGTYSEYSAQAAVLTQAVEQFRADFGCYPRSVEDLLSTAPKRGLDASGNVVQLGRGTGKKHLDALPRDPATGRTSTWRIDLASPELVTSSGFATTVFTEHGG